MSTETGDHTIVNDLGLHARAASKLVALANKFDAEVWVGSAVMSPNSWRFAFLYFRYSFTFLQH